ncbi:MAG: beta-lactamase family protein, partial [Chloroflexi bacterium]|nr:beta-lactamase family protein [Chloroflexota bacterium]
MKRPSNRRLARSAPSFAASREKIREGRLDGRLPSVAVGVYRRGEPVWEEAFGWADREKQTPATPHTMYSLASISKPLTALGIMILVERGLIDLDRPVNDYLGDAKLNGRVGDAAGATVRRIMQHTAGLPLHFQFFYEDEPYRRPPMDATILRYGNLVRAPGERYQYSNLGYGILDYVIERVSGTPYGDFMREEVFLPLGMFRSSIDIPPALSPFAAVRYGADGIPYPFYTFDHPGGSAAYASVHDLARLAFFVMGAALPDQKPILKPETIAAMLT